MVYIIRSVILITSILLCNETTTAQNIKLCNVTIIDFDDNGKYKERYNSTIYINNGIISRVASEENELDQIDSVNCIDLSGKFVIPGLIDSHVHLETDSGNPATKNDPSRSTKDCVTVQKYLNKYLRSGITTLVDLGISREKISCLYSTTVIPNVFYSGEMLIDTVNKTNKYFLDRCNHNNVICLGNIEDAKKAVLRSKNLGASFVKIRDTDYNSEIRNIIIKEAREYNMPIFEHQPKIDQRLNIFRHGFEKPTSFAHAPPMEWRNNTLHKDHKYYEELIDSMRNHNVGLVSTISIGHSKKGKQDGLMVLGFANAGEVLFSLGTDAGIFGIPHGNALLEEYDLIASKFGSWRRALKACTIDAAKIIQKEKLIGNIVEGKMADLIILNERPRSSSILKNLCFVVKNGRLVYPENDCDNN